VPSKGGSGAHCRGLRCPLQGGQVPIIGGQVPIVRGGSGKFNDQVLEVVGDWRDG